METKMLGTSQVQTKDIEELQGWFYCFLRQAGIKDYGRYVNFSSPALWHETLKDMTRKEIAGGFIRFVRMFESAKDNHVSIVPVNPGIFKTLCFLN